MPPKVMNGARALVQMWNPARQKISTVGLWNSFDYHVDYDVQPVFILGRYSPAEIQTVGMEAVRINAGGWRVIDHGAFVECGLTNVKDLIRQEYLLLRVIDRQTRKAIATIRGCIPTSTTSGLSVKSLTEQRNSYLGMLMDDETETQVEAPGGPDGTADLP